MTILIFTKIYSDIESRTVRGVTWKCSRRAVFFRHGVETVVAVRNNAPFDRECVNSMPRPTVIIYVERLVRKLTTQIRYFQTVVYGRMKGRRQSNSRHSRLCITAAKISHPSSARRALVSTPNDDPIGPLHNTYIEPILFDRLKQTYSFVCLNIFDEICKAPTYVQKQTNSNDVSVDVNFSRNSICRNSVCRNRVCFPLKWT